MTQDFDKYSRFGAYHWDWYKNKPRYYNHVNKVRDWIKEKNVLDIGAGDGLMCHIVGMRGIDTSPVAVELAIKGGVDVMVGDAYCLPFPDESFEAAYIGDTLEHLEFPSNALKEARRIVTDFIYVSGPVNGGVLETYEYENSKWSANEIQRKVEEAGFKLEGEIELITLGTKRMIFYAKFRKI